MAVCGNSVRKAQLSRNSVECETDLIVAYEVALRTISSSILI